MTRIAAIVASAGLAAAAHADILAGWTFEVSQPTTAGPHSAENGTGVAWGFHAGATTYSSPAGNGSARSFSSNNWQIGDYYEFQTSTLGYMSITLTFDHTSSNTGPRDFVVQWSLDGVNFVTMTSYSVLANASPNPVWSSSPPRHAVHTYGPFAAPPLLNNQPSVWFRLVNSSTVSANGGTVASAGTSRVDNVEIEGVIIPTPGTLALVGLAGLIAARRRR